MPPSRNILFDLDGTLSDPGLGIAHSLQHALRSCGAAPPPEDELRWCVGPPLREIFARLLPPLPGHPQVDHDQVERAIAFYLERYAHGGAAESRAYPGVAEMLATLSEASRLYLVTAKNTEIAERILTALALRPHFDGVVGTELDGRFRDKGDAVRFIVQQKRLAPPATVVVGDREHDIAAGRRNGLLTVGVTYG
ncbi:MAG: HAD hydrolase-like protein, partial [Candidatus Binataceae bacterium]